MKNNGLLYALLIAAVVLSLITTFVALGIPKVNQGELANKVTAQVLSKIPEPKKVDEQAIADKVASQIVIPKAPEPPKVPEAPKAGFNEDKFLDIWEKEYADEIEELETEAYDVAVVELEDDNYELIEDWLKENIEGFDELEEVEDYVEDYDVKIIKLGLDEDEDKVAEVEFELEVEYSLEEGIAHNYEKDLIATANVVFEEGEYDDEEVDFVIT